MTDLREHLQQTFGLDEFRPAQREVIEDVLAGRDVLCVMPTGAGKSLCYQLPAVVQGGLTIVVSPLISLMEDQVAQLRDEGIKSVFLNSSLSVPLQRQVMDELRAGYEGLLYVAPERFFNANFREFLKDAKPKLLAIDEAHCISQWGHDFRTEYSRLGEVRQRLGCPPTIALTATATEDVRDDIVRGLGLAEPRIVVTGFDRPNLMYESRRISKVVEKQGELISLLSKEAGSAIVYCATRRAVEEVAPLLSTRFPARQTFAYHAGMEAASRTQNQEQFMSTPGAIAVATNAFGMGINKPDVRCVIHYNLPGTLEAYYQEAGRAGRDGLAARCVVLFSYQDRATQEYFIDKLGEDAIASSPEEAAMLEERKRRARDKLEKVIQYAQAHRCRRQTILDYFGDEQTIANCRCDICRRGNDTSTALADDPAAPQVSDDAEKVVLQILSAVARLKGQFGAGVAAEVLCGANNEKIQRWELDKLSVFGLLRAYATKRVIAMLHRLIESGLVRQRDPERKFMPMVELTPVGLRVMKAEQPIPGVLWDILPRAGGGGQGRATRVNRLHDDPRSDESQIDENTDPEAAERFARLRAMRQTLARQKQLPAYCICHDSTLRLIAKSPPRDADALADIKGMGPHKVKEYGQQILAALRGEAIEPAGVAQGDGAAE